MMRNSLCYVSYKDRKGVATDLKAVYNSATDEEAETHLEEFAEKWDARYPLIAKSWRGSWARIIPMFGYPEGIRRAVYTTNAIESLNMSLRKVIKTRASFPNEEAAFKLLYRALKNISKKWTMPVRDWSGAMNQFAIIFEGRVPMGGIDQNSFTQSV
jgi:putative transposase